MVRFYFIEIKSKRRLNFLVLFQMSLAADRGENMMDQRSQIMTNSVSLSKCFSFEFKIVLSSSKSKFNPVYYILSYNDFLVIKNTLYVWFITVLMATLYNKLCFLLFFSKSDGIHSNCSLLYVSAMNETFSGLIKDLLKHCDRLFLQQQSHFKLSFTPSPKKYFCFHLERVLCWILNSLISF